MAETISGHPAASSYSDSMLASGQVPGFPRVKLTHAKPALPLFLHMAAALYAEVAPPSKYTWSIAIRPPRAGSGISDHAGWAVDVWPETFGQNTGEGPSKMPAEMARKVSMVLERYRTASGDHIFGWGVRKPGAGVTYTGTTYHRLNDPMHIYIDKGVDADDLRETRVRMGIRMDGGNAKPSKPLPPLHPAFTIPQYPGGIIGTGSKHHAVVRAIQRALGIHEDGRFGEQTAAAVRRWKRWHPKTWRDGAPDEVGPATYVALMQVIRAREAKVQR